ncbi:MAG: hypothetical protein PSX42_07420 [bacterium]|nr:hypothetical protein [bacterium]
MPNYKETMYTFEDKNSEAKFKDLLDQYSEFKKDNTSSVKATEVCTNAWHIIDWIYNEFPNIHSMSSIGNFRDSLYPHCQSLKIMHDIANGSKHSKVSRPKASIKKTNKHFGPFSNVFSREFDQTHLEIEMEDETTLYFVDEIELVIIFWKDYFKNTLNIK